MLQLYMYNTEHWNAFTQISSNTLKLYPLGKLVIWANNDF